MTHDPESFLFSSTNTMLSQRDITDGKEDALSLTLILYQESGHASLVLAE